MAVEPRDDSSETRRHRIGLRTALARIETTIMPVTCASLDGGMRLVSRADATIMLSVDACREICSMTTVTSVGATGAPDQALRFPRSPPA
jgi:hypothetical protein